MRLWFERKKYESNDAVLVESELQSLRSAILIVVVHCSFAQHEYVSVEIGAGLFV